MRPTEIQGMQLAHQKTPGPGHLNPQVSYNGKRLGFGTDSKNQKCYKMGLCLDKKERFYQYDHWAKVTGKFVGPNSYSDQKAWLLQNKQPCPTTWKKPIFGANGNQGDVCFVQQGHLTKYEPTLEKNRNLKKQKKLKINLTYQLNKVPAAQEALNPSQLSQLSKKKSRSKNRNAESMSALRPRLYGSDIDASQMTNYLLRNTYDNLS